MYVVPKEGKQSNEYLLYTYVYMYFSHTFDMMSYSSIKHVYMVVVCLNALKV